MTVPFTSGEFHRLPTRPRGRERGPLSLLQGALRHHPGSLGLGLALALSLVVTVGWLLRGTPEDHDQAPDAPALTAPVWTTIPDPVPVFRLDLSGLAEKPSFEARVHALGGGREDIFTAGSPSGHGGFMRWVVYRPGSEAKPSPTFFLALARRAAEEGYAVSRSGTGSPLPTRFGATEAADVTLSAAGRDHACMAWRFETEAVDLQMFGWACGSADKPVTRATLSCMLDRLDLHQNTGDKALKTFFSAAEKSRTAGCPAPRPTPAVQRRSA